MSLVAQVGDEAGQVRRLHRDLQRLPFVDKRFVAEDQDSLQQQHEAGARQPRGIGGQRQPPAADRPLPHANRRRHRIVPVGPAMHPRIATQIVRHG